MKHHNILTILLLVALLLSCSKAILDRQQFTALLIDIHQTDAMLAELNLRRDGSRAANRRQRGPTIQYDATGGKNA